MADDQSWIFFKLLLNKFSKEDQESKILLLPEEDQKLIQAIGYRDNTPELLLASNSQRLEKMHYSWFQEAFKKIPPSILKVIAPTLPQDIQKGLGQEILEHCEGKEPYSEALSHFLFSYFFRLWQEEHDNKTSLPKEFLEKSVSSFLLECKKSEIIHVIDLLAMHDLAHEVRHVVDKKLLQSILSCLTEAQRKYLKLCLHQLSKIQAKPLNAKVAYKDKKKFIKELHKHGMMRFAIALSGESKEFLWHFLRILDTGRARFLSAHITPDEPEKSQAIVRQEVLQIIQQSKAKEVV